jgi:hypothetical protein
MRVDLECSSVLPISETVDLHAVRRTARAPQTFEVTRDGTANVEGCSKCTIPDIASSSDTSGEGSNAGIEAPALPSYADEGLIVIDCTFVALEGTKVS